MFPQAPMVHSLPHVHPRSVMMSLRVPAHHQMLWASSAHYLSACSCSSKLTKVNRFVFAFLALLSEARKQWKSNVPSSTLLMKHQRSRDVTEAAWRSCVQNDPEARSQPQPCTMVAVSLYYGNIARSRLRIQSLVVLAIVPTVYMSVCNC